MFISPERLDDPDFIDRANRTYLFGMFAEECGANGDMAMIFGKENSRSVPRMRF